MQTKREYLIGLGLAKPGRGKFSREGMAALAKAEAEGVVFADNKPTPTAPKSTEPVKPAPVDSGNSQYLTPDDYRFPEAEYRAYSFIDGKKVKVSLRECCNLCRVSLVNHGCDAPTILGGQIVKIERR